MLDDPSTELLVLDGVEGLTPLPQSLTLSILIFFCLAWVPPPFQDPWGKSEA